MWTEATHWRVFNIMARVFGLMAVAVAFGCLAWAAYFVVHPEAARNVETAGLPEGAVDAVVGAIAGTIAAFVLTRRPYTGPWRCRIFRSDSPMDPRFAE
jgi:TRAP-type C4-dicarboxylate transport system permease small subunit